MRCPSCGSDIQLRKGDYEKISIWKYKFNCESCNEELGNNLLGEAVRTIGFIVLMFGVLTFGGSWPIPYLGPVLSTIISVVGCFVLFFGVWSCKNAYKFKRS